jgi:Protein of unknown function (DUF3060)
MFRLVLLSSCIASIAFAQVTVTGKNGKTVKIGSGTTGVDVQSGNKQVKVKTGTTGVQVEGTDAADDAAAVAAKTEGASATVKVAPGTVAVENAGPAPVAADGKWVIQGQGRTETHACAANEDIEVNGQGHTLTFTGPCRTLRVNGQGNTVVTDVAASIFANGMNNTVSWKNGADGKKPKISLGGMSNAAPQVK